jgi:hypothetical protein
VTAVLRPFWHGCGRPRFSRPIFPRAPFRHLARLQLEPRKGMAVFIFIFMLIRLMAYALIAVFLGIFWMLRTVIMLFIALATAISSAHASRKRGQVGQGRPSSHTTGHATILVGREVDLRAARRARAAQQFAERREAAGQRRDQQRGLKSSSEPKGTMGSHSSQSYSTVLPTASTQLAGNWPHARRCWHGAWCGPRWRSR